MAAVSVFEVRWSKKLQDGTERTSDQLREGLKTLAKKWVFQEERGDTGYEHFQGRISLFKRRRKPEIMKLMQSKGFPVPEYLEPTTTEEHQKVAFYVMKDETRVAGPWSNKDNAQYRPRAYGVPAGGWYPWQQKVIASRDIVEDRMINLVIDPIGKNGKTVVASWLHLEGKGISLPLLMDQKELSEAACAMLMDADNHEPRLILMDMPRAVSKKALSGVFTAIENIKNGRVIDRRYHFKEWWFEPPQVWVFSNRMPNLAYMSADRWRVWEITPEKDLRAADLSELKRKRDDDDEAIDHEDARWDY